MTDTPRAPDRLRIRKFFFRGLAILLPSVITIWLLFAAYNFVHDRFAAPINRGIKSLVLTATPWPRLDAAELTEHLSVEERRDRDSGKLRLDAAVTIARARALNEWWEAWPVMNLIGLIVALVLIYIVGGLLGSYIGRRVYARGEEWLKRVPLINMVYPHVKQITEFVFGGDEGRKAKIKFNRVVAVQYPRKGLWSIGLVTGDTLRAIQGEAAVDCMTVFIPSSPTPFTGYVITVPRDETIELPLTIDEALRFTISGGVLIPDAQQIHRGSDGAAATDLTNDTSRRPLTPETT